MDIFDKIVLRCLFDIWNFRLFRLEDVIFIVKDIKFYNKLCEVG